MVYDWQPFCASSNIVICQVSVIERQLVIVYFSIQLQHICANSYEYICIQTHLKIANARHVAIAPHWMSLSV